MIGFLIIAIAIYSFSNVYASSDTPSLDLSTNNKKQSGLALLIQYTTQLSNYLLFFTMSMWEIKGQAVSLERVSKYVEASQSVRNRMQSA